MAGVYLAFSIWAALVGTNIGEKAGIVECALTGEFGPRSAPMTRCKTGDKNDGK